MTAVYVFVEGPTDAVFLRRVLPEEVLKDAELVIGGGEAGIPSLARTLLVRRRKPIAVLINSDSLAADVIEERKQSIEELIQAADGSIPVKVVAAVPVIEAWFFAVPEAIERVLGEKVSPELVFLGKRDPQGVLQQLAANSKKSWDTNQAMGLLDARDIDRIRALPEVMELTAFLQKMQQGDQAA